MKTKTPLPFSSRVLCKGKAFISSIYWSRSANSKQSYVMLNVDADNNCVLCSVMVFAFDQETKDSYVLLRVSGYGPVQNGGFLFGKNCL